MKLLRKSEKGFTLMELIVILAILGILGAVLVPNIAKFIGRGSAEAAATEIQAIQQAMDLYMADNNLTAVTAQGAATRDMSTIIANPPNQGLYPNYTRFATAGRTGGYTWDVAGKVTAQGSW